MIWKFTRHRNCRSETISKRVMERSSAPLYWWRWVQLVSSAAGVKKVDCSQKQGCRLPSKAHWQWKSHPSLAYRLSVIMSLSVLELARRERPPRRSWPGDRLPLRRIAANFSSDRTNLLSDELGYRYQPGHLQNPNFAGGTCGWSVLAAEEGSRGTGILQGRVRGSSRGNNFV